jgi:hypothetical protein
LTLFANAIHDPRFGAYVEYAVVSRGLPSEPFKNTGGDTLDDTVIVEVPSTMTKDPDHAESDVVALEIVSKLWIPDDN